MAADLDSSDRCLYRSLEDKKPMRTIVMVTNPYRYQSQLQSNFQEFVRNFVSSNRSRKAKRELQ
jgi:LysR family hydrogen peroxide-inducible transcriptional activator